MGDQLQRWNELPAWREKLCESFFRLDVRPMVSDPGLRGSLAVVESGAIRAAQVDVLGGPHMVRRARSWGEDGCLMMSMQVQGTCVVRQGDREARLLPGDMAVYDARSPYELVFPHGGHRQIVLRVPIAEAPARLLEQTAVRIDGANAYNRAVGSLLRELPRAVPGAESVQVQRLTRSVLDLAAHALPVGSDVDFRRGQLQAAMDFIESNVEDAGLSPGGVAGALNISLAQLHRTFRHSDFTVGRYIKWVRLQRAADDLRDETLSHLTAAEIGLRRGFKDATHFSRAFTADFGVSPGTWRRSRPSA